MPRPGQTTIDTTVLYHAVNRRRERYGLSWREAVRQITGGTSTTLPYRLRDGGAITADMLGAIMVWLGEWDLRPYLTPHGR